MFHNIKWFVWHGRETDLSADCTGRSIPLPWHNSAKSQRKIHTKIKGKCCLRIGGATKDAKGDTLPLWWSRFWWQHIAVGVRNFWALSVDLMGSNVMLWHEKCQNIYFSSKLFCGKYHDTAVWPRQRRSPHYHVITAWGVIFGWDKIILSHWWGSTYLQLAGAKLAQAIHL